MEPLFAWHQLAADVALAYRLPDSSELEMATQLSQAIQSGTVSCWKASGEPIRGAVALENIRNPVPHLTVAEGNAWLKRAGYLQEWVPAKDLPPKNGTRKRWTEDEVNRLADYRQRHTEEQTAEYFGVSGPRVREVLAKSGTQRGIRSDLASEFRTP